MLIVCPSDINDKQVIHGFAMGKHRLVWNDSNMWIQPWKMVVDPEYIMYILPPPCRTETLKDPSKNSEVLSSFHVQFWMSLVTAHVWEPFSQFYQFFVVFRVLRRQIRQWKLIEEQFLQFHDGPLIRTRRSEICVGFPRPLGTPNFHSEDTRCQTHHVYSCLYVYIIIYI